MSAPVRLHLGCGEVYIPGYVNVDYPLTEHSVQHTSVADVQADLTTLAYPANTVREVRLHHTFEHFDRVTAMRLLIEWREWLEPGGALVIETPDFRRSALWFLLARTERSRAKLVRHLYGSQEAPWAVHYDGWYREKFERHLLALGYDTPTFERASWHGMRNITVTARKSEEIRTLDSQIEAATALFRESLVDESESEIRLLAVWVERLRAALEPASP